MTDTKKHYKETILPKLQKDLNIKNPMAVPSLKKIVINVGVKDAVSDKKNIERMVTAIAIVTGQKPKVTKARQSIAGFKVREGDAIGVVVTLRGNRMHAFFEKIINVVLPRIKDFRGVKRSSFDGQGNYSLGLYEYSVFPEIDPASVERLQGMEIIFVNSARTKEEGSAFMEALGMPFEKEKAK